MKRQFNHAHFDGQNFYLLFYSVPFYSFSPILFLSPTLFYGKHIFNAVLYLDLEHKFYSLVCTCHPT